MAESHHLGSIRSSRLSLGISFKGKDISAFAAGRADRNEVVSERVSQWKFGGYYEVTGTKAGGWPLVPIDSAPTDLTILHRKYLGAIENNNMIKSHRNKITVNQLSIQRLHRPRHYNYLEMEQKAARENWLALSQLTAQTKQ